MNSRRMITIISLAVAAFCISALTMLPGASALPDAQQTYTESDTFIVPNGVTSIEAYVFGQAGQPGDCNPNYGLGGAGAIAHVTFDVTTGESIHVHINEDGGQAAHYAGSGGSSADLRIGGDDLSDRVVVAGGGGGGACGDESGMAMKGGDGGNAGSTAQNGHDGYAVSAPEDPPDDTTTTTSSTLPPDNGASINGVTPLGDDDPRGLGGQAGGFIDPGDSGDGDHVGENGGTPEANFGGDSATADNPGGGGGGGYRGGGAGAGEDSENGSGGGGGGAGSSYIDSEIAGAITTGEGGNAHVLFYYTTEEDTTTTTTTTTTVPGPSGAYGSSLSDTTASLVSSPGGTVTVHGQDFKPDSDVTVTLHSTPFQLGVAHTNSQGSFVATYTLPANTSLGSHTIVLSGLNSAGNPASSVLALNVVQLPNTGMDTQDIVLASTALLMLGGCALVFARQRKRTGLI